MNDRPDRPISDVDYIHRTLAGVASGAPDHPTPSAMAAFDITHEHVAEVGEGLRMSDADLRAHRASYAMGAGNERLRVVAWLRSLALLADSPVRAKALDDLGKELEDSFADDTETHLARAPRT